MAEIAWHELADAAAGDRARAERSALSWDHRAKQEHLAVGAFSLLAGELAERGCEPIVLALVTRAASDEVRHAETCARMAACLRGETWRPVKWRGVPNVPKHESAGPEARVLYHMVEMCCLSETFTGYCMAEMMARATHPVSRAVVQSLLEDEIDHGKVGWAYLAERAGEKTLGELSRVLPELATRAMKAGLSPAAAVPEDDDPLLERFAYLATSTVAALYRRAYDEVIAPGFEHLGVDTRETTRAIDLLAT